jgi:hypothetical protein
LYSLRFTFPPEELKKAEDSPPDGQRQASPLEDENSAKDRIKMTPGPHPVLSLNIASFDFFRFYHLKNQRCKGNATTRKHYFKLSHTFNIGFI